MRICFLGPADSAHIVKWAKWFSSRGHDVHVVSFSNGFIEGVNVHIINLNLDRGSSDFAKMKYLLSFRRVNQIIDDIKPDVVNAHYATSYGTVMALTREKNYILSVWGGDIYDFPRKSIFHRAMLKYSLRKASILLSTSKVMAEEAAKYTNRSFIITPFGIDMNLFSPAKRKRAESKENFIIGTVKALEDKYGIKYILQAARIVKDKRPDIPLKIRIAGKGSKEKDYRNLSEQLELTQDTTWLGFISQEDAAIEWANMDIAIIPSIYNSESFGVSAVEAEACGTAIIVSDIPGLMEATLPGISSIVVPRENSEMIAENIISLYDNPKLREQMGIAGRKYANENYEITECFENVEAIYWSFIAQEKLQ